MRLLWSLIGRLAASRGIVLQRFEWGPGSQHLHGQVLVFRGQRCVQVNSRRAAHQQLFTAMHLLARSRRIGPGFPRLVSCGRS